VRWWVGAGWVIALSVHMVENSNFRRASAAAADPLRPI
jgi:hypothetical protein